MALGRQVSKQTSLGHPARVPGYPQKMQGMNMKMNKAGMMKIIRRREARGMRAGWSKGVKGLMTVLRVLPEDLYNRVMLSDEDIKPGEIFEALVKGRYQSRGSST